MTLLTTIVACETQVWEALKRGDAAADEAALDTGFLGVYSDGFSDKAGHVDQLADGPTIASYTISGARIMTLGDDHAVLSYRADFTRISRTTPEAMFVSSIWRRTAQGWINVFSQDTVATG